MAFNPGRRIGAFKPVRAQALDAERAEAIAASSLAVLSEEPQRLVRFLSETGMSPADLQARAGERDVLIAVLEHVLADESLLLVTATRERIAPETLTLALALLQGPGMDG